MLNKHIIVHVILTIFPLMRVGYELLNSERGAEHRVDYHKFVSDKQWHNCFIRAQTLDCVYGEVLNVNPCKHRDCIQ